MAEKSSLDSDYHLLLAHDLHYLSDENYDQLLTELTEIKQMLTAFIKKLKADS